MNQVVLEPQGTISAPRSARVDHTVRSSAARRLELIAGTRPRGSSARVLACPASPSTAATVPRAWHVARERDGPSTKSASLFPRLAAVGDVRVLTITGFTVQGFWFEPLTVNLRTRNPMHTIQPAAAQARR